jgi:hypothetical protein
MIEFDSLPDEQAAMLDREADALLHLGFHAEAERLAHRAAALRNEIPELEQR